MYFIRVVRRRLRCLLRTRGAHEVDLHSGKCRYCRRQVFERPIAKV